MSVSLIREYVRAVLNEQVRKSFVMQLPDDLLNLSSVFKKAGHQLYVVGGSVRDALLGKEPKDYDLATDAVPDVVVELLNSLPGHKVIEVGKSFGVVKVITPENNEYEIATFRRDIGKGRRPDSVEFTDIETDVKRRDLTINALFYDIDAQQIVDYVGGIDDIQNGVVRAVGDPTERFDEDRLRILRALRFAGRMGSELDPESAAAIKANNSLTGVSPERIRDEFLKGLKSAKNVQRFLDMIGEFDLWSQIFPGMSVSPEGISTRNVMVAIAQLLDANDPIVVAKKLNSLKYSASEVAHVRFLLMLKSLTPETAYKLRKLFDASHIDDETVREFASAQGIPSISLITAFLKYSPSVDGQDLMSQGFSGQQLGRELERQETLLFKELLNGR